ncbi:MAG: LON peptidase substrate-binding domain-containing protein [Acidobacteria bacterium]|nr:LON peptidase substrate-binding domain-containing protein [Acidobacteriota bacterium]
MGVLVPLFPLDLVLFPGTPLPLHVFEPRYKEMISDCLREKSVFGIVRSKEGGIAEIGCTAEIMEVTKRYDDGRLDIVVEGKRRFEVVEVNEERSFLQGEVMYFDDEPGAASREKQKRALELFTNIIEVVGAEAEPPEADDPLLSFQLVAPLPLDLDFKQTLLGMRSEAERISAITEYYEALLPRMQRTMRARQRAGGNGHVS